MEYMLYKATNKINNEHYIGVTTRDLETRVIEHISHAKKDRGYAFHEAIKIHGIENFDFMETCKVKNREIAIKVERGLISGLNTKYPNGYNKNDGSSGPSKGHEAYNKGIPHKLETRLKMSKTRRGKRLERVTCPHCDKIGGKSLMGRYHFNNCKSIRG